MRVIDTIESLERSGCTGACVLVPTMGALHDGHGALIRQGTAIARARGLPGGCVVSVFVNPTQFNELEDFDRYPRALDADVERCGTAGADVVFAPDAGEIYPAGEPSSVPELPEVALRPGLEDAARPGHFEGVCRVVLRLFRLVSPRVAVFGEKDWQQLQVVRAMAAKEAPDVEIIPGRTVREPDGLAMSSRNRFLEPEERRAALALHGALRAAGRVGDPDGAEEAMRRVLEGAGVRPDYAVVRDARTLVGRPRLPGGDGRALVAARLGAVRLIDNAPWPGGADGE